MPPQCSADIPCGSRPTYRYDWQIKNLEKRSTDEESVPFPEVARHMLGLLQSAGRSAPAARSAFARQESSMLRSGSGTFAAESADGSGALNDGDAEANGNWHGGTPWRERRKYRK